MDFELLNTRQKDYQFNYKGAVYQCWVGDNDKAYIDVMTRIELEKEFIKQVHKWGDTLFIDVDKECDLCQGTHKKSEISHKKSEN